jgi:hypothetical protein
VNRFFIILILFPLLFSHPLQLTAQEKPIRIFPEHKIRLNVPEPSDLAWFAGAWFVVSDNGFLYRCSEDFTSCVKTDILGADFEALAADGEGLWVSEESLRLLHRYNAQLERMTTLSLQENGPLNAGFEALAWDPGRRLLIGVTESPPVIFEIENGIQRAFQYRLAVRGDISAATVHEGALWLLGDENRKLYRLSLPSYAIERVYALPVVNPEGVAFDSQGRLLVLSDDRQTVYCFRLP